MSTTLPPPSPAEPHYLACCRELLARHGDQLRPGRLYSFNIRHDDWCPELSGAGPCRCEPVVDLVEVNTADPEAN